MTRKLPYPIVPEQEGKRARRPQISVPQETDTSDLKSTRLGTRLSPRPGESFTEAESSTPEASPKESPNPPPSPTLFFSHPSSNTAQKSARNGYSGAGGHRAPSLVRDIT